MKSYTDLEQSKKLAEILPLESADMLFQLGEDKYADSIRVPLTKEHWEQMMPDINPCWSLAALLKMLKDYQLFSNGLIVYINNESYKIDSDNLVDACVAMIIRLYELKLL